MMSLPDSLPPHSTKVKKLCRGVQARPIFRKLFSVRDSGYQWASLIFSHHQVGIIPPAFLRLQLTDNDRSAIIVPRANSLH